MLQRRGLAMTAEYVLDGASAWKGEHRDQLTAALAGARTGRFHVLLCLALADQLHAFLRKSR